MKRLIIIECKNSEGHNTNGETQQGQRYLQYGVPLTYVLSIQDADNLINKLMVDNKHLISITSLKKYRQLLQILSSDIKINPNAVTILKDEAILKTWFDEIDNF